MTDGQEEHVIEWIVDERQHRRGWQYLSGCHPAQPTPAFSSCPQLRLSPTLLSSYDLYDDMIFILMTHAQDYHHPSSSRLYAPSSLLPFGRSPLGGGR